jgi:uncharacterized membrane protein
MTRWVLVAVVAGAFAACSSEESSKPPAGAAGEAGANGGDDSATQAGSGANSGGAASLGEGGAAEHAGQHPGGAAGQLAGGGAGFPGGEAGQHAGGARATCDATSCENDGVCPADGGSSCECTGGFTGPHCELPLFEVLALPAEATKMSASAISADGLVVVGNVAFPTYASGYRWTRATGVVLLDSLPGDDASLVTQISADSNVVIGSSSLSSASFDPVIWSDGVEPSQTLMTNAWKALSATHVNADGTVVAGSGTLANDSYSAFRWTKATGPVAIGIASPTDTASVAGISADGTTIVGNSGVSSAFIWTEAGGSKKLATLSGDDGAFVQGMSADATTIIGNSLSTAVSSKRVLWRDGAAPVALDPLDPGTSWTCGGGPIQTCTTVYADGSVIYTQRAQAPVRYTAAGLETFVNIAGKGVCLAVGPTVGPVGKVAGTCFGPPLAVMWDADGGKVAKLADVLTDAGADASKLANASVSIVRAVSANGDTIVGDDFFGTLVWVARPPN